MSSATHRQPPLPQCQWCRAPLSPDATLCPVCGAVVPRQQLAEALPEDAVASLLGLASVEPMPEQSSVMPNPVGELALLALAILIGLALGWLLLPLPLAALFQGLLGVPAQPDDLGRLGALLGGLAGLGLGATVRLLGRRGI